MLEKNREFRGEGEKSAVRCWKKIGGGGEKYSRVIINAVGGGGEWECDEKCALRTQMNTERMLSRMVSAFGGKDGEWGEALDALGTTAKKVMAVRRTVSVPKKKNGGMTAVGVECRRSGVLINVWICNVSAGSGRLELWIISWMCWLDVRARG